MKGCCTSTLNSLTDESAPMGAESSRVATHRFYDATADKLSCTAYMYVWVYRQEAVCSEGLLAQGLSLNSPSLSPLLVARRPPSSITSGTNKHALV